MQMINKYNIRKLLIYLSLILAFYHCQDASAAQPFNDLNSIDNNNIAQTICKVVLLFRGKAGHGIAAVAVIFLAVSLFMGKMSWGVALVMAIGIGLIFGAEQIVHWISGQGGVFC